MTSQGPVIGGGRRAPRRVGVVGAGMTGLACAWFLQEEGVEVTVLERSDVAAGASWGNAGFLSPALCVPLTEPSVLRYGLRAVADPRSPVAVPLRWDRRLPGFLTQFVGHCTQRQWRRGMSAYRPLNEGALEAFDVLTKGGVGADTTEASVTAAFRTEQEAHALLAELGHVVAGGQPVDIDLVTGDDVHDSEPLLGPSIRLALRIRGQRFIDPPAFLSALADSIRERGGEIRLGVDVAGVREDGSGLVVEGKSGKAVERYDAVVLASGAWLPDLAASHGVRTMVHGGRGYSFSVATRTPPRGPLYFPGLRIAGSPYRDGMRLVGIMEFQHPDAPPNPRRLSSILAAAQSVLTGIDWASVQDQWVGARPVTSDGLPLVGATATPGLYVTGGHGMWGITLGPLTGQLLARQIVTGEAPLELVPLRPCR